MTIIPAIDILGERCVYLVQGDYKMANSYDIDPVTVARNFEQAGARRLHIVDLDAARGNRQVNFKKIRKIRKAVSCMIEIGGGIRTDDDIERLLDVGIERLIVGTTFARTPEMVEGWASHYGDIFMASIDARDGRVYIEGWEQETRSEDIELAARAHASGATAIIYTNIMRDGMLEGPDIARTNSIATVSETPVILSGGMSSLDDLKAIQEKAHKNVVGVIIGKALLEQKIDLVKAIETYDRPEAEERW